MLILDDIHLLYSQRQSITHQEYLKLLLQHIHSLQYQDGNFINEVCTHLKEQLVLYAKSHSIVYNSSDIITKDELQNKQIWYVNGLNAAISQTGGSTTGERFQYLRWADTYLNIEGDIHYKAILQEFGLDRPINILYLMLDQLDDRKNDTLVRVYKTQNVLISHGMKQHATIHEVIKNRLYYTNYFEFYREIIKYTSENSIDVILAPSYIIESLAWNIKQLNYTNKLCKLLSNTGSKANNKTMNSLIGNGNIDNWCDHMRCWDGGVTFFTCRHHTAHLLDGLSWAYTNQNRLISYDFYSLPAPFVNYWNGDFATIDEEYQKCKCGRSYRPFVIHNTRSIALNNINSNYIQNIIKMAKDTTIKRMEGSNHFLRLFTELPLSIEERNRIRKALPNFEINFIIEESLDG